MHFVIRLKVHTFLKESMLSKDDLTTTLRHKIVHSGLQIVHPDLSDFSLNTVFLLSCRAIFFYIRSSIDEFLWRFLVPKFKAKRLLVLNSPINVDTTASDF